MSKRTQKDNDAVLLEAAVLSGNHTPEPMEAPFDFQTFKLEKIEDFEIYNAHVRKHNRLCLHERNKMKIKVPTEEFYPKFKTKFFRFQQMENVNSDPKTLICSPFEYTALDKRDMNDAYHVLVSNSLSLRDKWLHEIGGTGIIPVDAKRGRGKGHYSIYLIGSDLLSPRLWDQIEILF